MQRRLVFLCLCISLLLALPGFAQGTTPAVTVDDQISLNGKVMIGSVYSAGPGWVVIHADNNGQPGRVAGHAAVDPGWTYQLEVPIDATIATPTLYAVLNVDDGTVGQYEYDGLSGLDNPVIVNGKSVTASFKVNIIDAHDQFIQNDTFVADAVTVQQDGWLVIHSDNNGAPGPVLGEERVLAGTSTNVEVTLATNGRTETLWPMLHVDTGTPGVYEFGTVQGADPPVVLRGVTATTQIWTVPHVRVEDQIVVKGDGQGAPNTSVVADSVLSQGPGWLVIHNDSNGSPGPVVGYVAVNDGLNTDVTVDNLNPSKLTPVLWPMLHVDTGTIGQYEFGTVAGADAPVMVDGQVLTFPINAAPSLVMHAQDPLPGEATGSIRFVVDEALIDAPGWLAIHQDTNNQPGPVIATAELHPGSNRNILIEVDGTKAGDQVFPMLHYDTGTVGQYEFGTVPNADPPVSVSGQVIVAPLRLTTAPATPEPTAASSTTTQTTSNACTVTPRGTVNQRSGAGTGYGITSQLIAGQSALVTGQTKGSDGFVWYQLSDGSFVRADVVNTSGDCSAVPSASAASPQAAPTVKPPNATPEVGG